MTWILSYLIVVFECDFPILEAVCHGWPLQSPVEIWRKLTDVPDNRLLIELRNTLRRNQWRCICPWQNKYIAISKKNVIYFNQNDAYNICLEERFNDLGISIIKFSNGSSTWKIHQMSTYHDWTFNIQKPVDPHLSLAQEMLEFSKLFSDYRKIYWSKELTLNDFSEFLVKRQFENIKLRLDSII